MWQQSRELNIFPSPPRWSFATAKCLIIKRRDFDIRNCNWKESSFDLKVFFLIITNELKSHSSFFITGFWEGEEAQFVRRRDERMKNCLRRGSMGTRYVHAMTISLQPSMLYWEIKTSISESFRGNIKSWYLEGEPDRHPCYLRLGQWLIFHCLEKCYLSPPAYLPENWLCSSSRTSSSSFLNSFENEFLTFWRLSRMEW